ncbi:MAG: ABC transporter ATP-binding protein [Bacteroidetes bacterium]|nr:ABC transporter ATP-binding protein [Bacteroidota bacterium]
MTHPLLQIIDLNKQLPKGFSIKNISFNQYFQQKIAIVGISGAGKSTLLKMIAGLLQPTSGKIIFNNERVIGPDEQLLPGHKKIGYLSQHYELLNNYIVKDLILFENKLTEQETESLFTICRINHLLLRKTNELSGGEKQRISLCMLLVKKPQLLLLDEPFSNLDLIHKTTLKKVLEDISDKLKITTLLASHDPSDILSWANEIIVIKDGSIMQQASATIIYNQPINEYVAGLLGIYNFLNDTQLLVITNEHFSEGNYIIRPQHISIATINNAMFSGKVVGINFFGNYYLANVLVDDFIITIMLLNKDVQLNELVSLSVDKNKIWKLS